MLFYLFILILWSFCMHLRIIVEAFSTFFPVIHITLAEQFISLQYLLALVHIQFYHTV